MNVYDAIVTGVEDSCSYLCSQSKNTKGEHLGPLPELFKAIILTKEMDDAWLDLIKDMKTSGRPKKVNLQGPSIHQSHERNVLSIM